MGRTLKADIWHHFATENNGNKLAGQNGCSAKCLFCGKRWACANVTRLASHLTECKPFLKHNSDENEKDDPDVMCDAEAMVPPAHTSASASTPCLQGATTSTQLKQTKLSTLFVADKMTPDQKLKADTLCARAFYSMSLPFQTIDNTYFQEFVHFLRPSYELPSQHKLKGPLLQDEYETVQLHMKRAINEASVVAVMSDGYTNVSGSGISNYVITTPAPYLFKTLDRGIERETSVNVAKEISTVIKEVGSKKVLLVLTDCATNMRGAWKLLITEYPHISCVGCADHCIQNFMHDLMKLCTLKNIAAKARSIVKEIKYSHVKLAAFQKVQSEKYENPCTLKLPPKTRFAYIVITLESLLKNREALEATVIDTSLDISKKIRNRVLDVDEKFWPKVQVALTVLRPLAVGMKILERDSATLSEALEVMFRLKKAVEECILEGADDRDDDDGIFNLNEALVVQKDFKRRFEMSFNSVHFAANLVDPRFMGGNLSDEHRLSAYEYLDRLADHLNISNPNGEIQENLGHLRDKTGFFAHDMLWKAAQSQRPSTWWRGLCGSQPLAPIASRLLELPATTCAAERNWNQYGLVHCKLRSRLTHERVNKLVSVKEFLNKSKQEKSKSISMKEVNTYFCEPTMNLSVSLQITQDDSEEEEIEGSSLEDSDVEEV